MGLASLGSNAPVPELISVGLDLREEGSVRIRQDQASGLLSMRDFCLAFYLDLKLPIYGH